MNIDNLVLDYRLPFGDWSVVEVTLKKADNLFTSPALFKNDDVVWRNKKWRVWDIEFPLHDGDATKLTLADLSS